MSITTAPVLLTTRSHATRSIFTSTTLSGLAALLLLPHPGSAAGLTTRQQTIRPVAIPEGTPPCAPSNVPGSALYGYSAWQVGPGEDHGRRFDLMPAGYAGAGNAARLASFFSFSDIHITDKESPAQVPYLGWRAPFLDPGPGGLNKSAYSPIILDTTHHLDAAVRTVNALHAQQPFHFGMMLGDNGNASQRNEIRWFIDVVDGQYITPSSGDHRGADTIDYQMPFQAAGLNPEIPWYEAIGNHDQYWMGVGYPTEKIRQAQCGTNILNISTNGPLVAGGPDGTGMYVGVVDGTTPYGEVIKWGETNLFATPPTVAADSNRLSVTTDNSSPTNYVAEFFNTTSLPRGHGFNLAPTHAGSLAACYAFEPLTNIPLKVIVLDNTCKSNALGQAPVFYGDAWVDAVRYAWLTNELQAGQDANQLMILAAHIPILPQTSLTDTNRSPMFYNAADETNLIATLHRYPNLILVMAGHRHMNVVTPFPSPDPTHPEYGFWQVETASLRDFPRQFRTWDLRRNSDNTISILTTCVDPMVESNSPAWKSLGYTVGAARIYGDISLTDTTSHAYNAELIAALTPAMQARLATAGSPLQPGGNDYNGDGRSDLAVYDTQAGNWYAYDLQAGQATLWAQPWGWPGAETVPGDYDGDAVSDLAVYDRNAGAWYVWSQARQEVLLWAKPWGWAGAEPVRGDYNGDAISDLAVYDQAAGVWYIMTPSDAVLAWQQAWGWPGAVTVPGDYDGDGIADLAVYDSGRGAWYVQAVAGNILVWDQAWGWAWATTVPGDFDGDGRSDLAVYDPPTGNWYVWSPARNRVLAWQKPWGWAGAVPVPGDFDGDTIADLAVFDTAQGNWYIWSLANDATIAWQQAWGWPGAMPPGGRP
jgi:metallophosphoesterase (TIGR03768 family)